LAPLGAGYTDPLRRAFENRWTDWHPAAGKRSGAYATGAAYDVHPYMLLNFNGDFDSVSTLAHEAGHAMHSHFSNGRQPYPCADYSIFVAEVASTFNEALLIERLLAEATTREEKIFLLGHWCDGIRATLFRQTFFAEFELDIHRGVERGEALTGEALSRSFLELLRSYQGHETQACEIDELFAVEWACVPHFYYDFYVYQYATGIVAANSLAHDVLNGKGGAQGRYLSFLESGGSDYPLEILRRAGVDLESPAPYEATFRAMDRKLDMLEALLDA
jgi:oligoendopeptidase F